MSQGNFGSGFSTGCGFVMGGLVCLGALSLVLCFGCFGGLGVALDGARQEREIREQREAIERMEKKGDEIRGGKKAGDEDEKLPANPKKAP